MVRLSVIATNGEVMEVAVEQLLAVDGVAFGGSQPSDAGLERRVTILENLVLNLLGEKSLQSLHPKASCSVESPPQSSPERQEPPAIQLPILSPELQSSLDESLV